MDEPKLRAESPGTIANEPDNIDKTLSFHNNLPL